MKKRIITSALALALAFSLCACTDNTSATESYSDSTSGTTASGKSSFEQSGDSVLLPESGYETSKPNQAIEEGKQIHYDYNKYGVDKKLHKSSHQYVSPYLMILHNQHYYLMAYSEYWCNMAFHRLDRITNMNISDKKATPIRNVSGYENGINYKELSSAMPYMFTDRPEHIDLIADIGIIDQVIDWFGSDIRIAKTDDDNKVRISVKASPNAMVHWAMQYANYVEVVSPEPLRMRVKEALENGLKKYE